jgi:hypothetical protein
MTIAAIGFSRPLRPGRLASGLIPCDQTGVVDKLSDVERWAKGMPQIDYDAYVDTGVASREKRVDSLLSGVRMARDTADL